MPSGSRGSGWFCCFTHPQAEHWAERNLRQQGYATFLPTVTVLRRDRALRSMTHPVQAPLWPRYVFVAFDPQHDPWQPINSTYGVQKLVSDSRGPRELNAGAWKALQGVVALAATQPPGSGSWASGDAVSLGKGHVMAGVAGVVVKVGKKTAQVAVLMLGELRNVTVALTDLVERAE